MIFNRNGYGPDPSGIQSQLNNMTGPGLVKGITQRTNQLLNDAANAITNSAAKNNGQSQATQPQNTDPQQAYQSLLNDSMSNLQNVENKGTAGREALQQQMQSDAAKQLLEQRARSGAAGMGLSGASQALDASTRAIQNRQQSMAVDQYDINQQQQIENAIQGVTNAAGASRQNTMNNAALAALELQLDKDLDGDGMIGGPNGHKVGANGWGDGNPSNNDQAAPKPQLAASETLTKEQARQDAQQLTNNQGDGTQNNPFGGVVGVTSDQAPNVIMQLVKDGILFQRSHIDGGAIIVGDQFGNYYKFDSGLGPLGMGGPGVDIQGWFETQSGQQI